MKFFITFAALIAVANCVPAVVNTGSSAVSRSEDGYGNYAFGYNEDHATGGTFRKEKGSHGVMTGSYGLRDADGRMRVVNYVADALGYRASVSSNEPGVDPHQPAAATTLNGAAPVVPVALAAPVVTKAYAAAPVAAYAAPVAAYGAAYGGLYGAPVAAPLAYGAPMASSYNVATSHVAAAPVAYAARVAAYAAPVAAYGAAYAAPVAASYNVATSHVAAAPLVAGYAHGGFAKAHY